MPVKSKENKAVFFRGFMTAFGDMLCVIGFSAEYMAARLYRAARNGAGLAAAAAGALAARFGMGLAAAGRDLLDDIYLPVRHFRHRRRRLKRAVQKARRAEGQDKAPARMFLGVRLKNTLQFVAAAGSYLLPAAAAAVLVLTVIRLTGMQYGLAVEVNGRVLGTVSDRAVVESAKSLLRERITLAPNQRLSDWQLLATYTIRHTSYFTNENQLADAILLDNSENPDNLSLGTGLYLDGRLYAATDDGEGLRAYLDSLLEKYRPEERQGARVSFEREVVCDDPGSPAVFIASSIEKLDTLVERLSGNVIEAETMAADGVDTLGVIAAENSLTMDALLRRNPRLAQQGTDTAQDGDGGADEDAQVNAQELSEYVPPKGERLLLRNAQPFLRVQYSLRREATQPIPYETLTEDDPEMPKGARRVFQQGQDGVLQVWDEYFYFDGELDRVERLDELTAVQQEPVDEIVHVGTKEPEPGAAPGTAPGGYIFPVPGSGYSSRGYVGSHHALDINAPEGTPIYASAGGVVTVAGWHWSYGNYVIIDHGGGINTLYAHCSTLAVAAGAQVAQGANIGAVGSTGNSTGNHCHLEVVVNGVRVDPVPYVGYPY